MNRKVVINGSSGLQRSERPFSPDGVEKLDLNEVPCPDSVFLRRRRVGDDGAKASCAAGFVL